ncbi:hypothetical protein PR202_gb01195 [Eleusine coracana subsp. coracana]|uniref:Methyltransferase n=1 Tax=Eleusine coracana subsp. coracana TaxID=191504 RepID=A0AAV5DVU7_ELECO|nr:hypothetical protein PR202_gb01195 [Eleusine coracana subsp. coracana]
MDMNANYGGFAAALSSDPVWIMNIVPHTMNNTLPVIYDRGLVGSYHDWCEPFSTYPRSYDLLHAFYLFSHYEGSKEDCSLEDIMLEMDRITRPQVVIALYILLYEQLSCFYTSKFPKENLSFSLNKLLPKCFVIKSTLSDKIGNIQAFIIIRDEKNTLSRIIDLAPKFLWDITTHISENVENQAEQVLISRKKFWAII